MKANKTIRPLGLKIFAGIYIFSSLVHLHALLTSFSYAKDIFLQSTPLWLLNLRYCFSLFLRIIGLSTGFGILFLKEIFRKIAIAISIFTICTLYWKHPYQVFAKHTELLDQKFAEILRSSGAPANLFSLATIPALIAHYVLDILFCGLVIFYFTRPKIKALFKR